MNSFSANIDTNEIVSDKINFKLLQQKFSQNCFIFNDIDDLNDNFNILEKGYEIWHILLSVAIILLILESTIINIFERKV